MRKEERKLEKSKQGNTNETIELVLNYTSGEPVYASDFFKQDEGVIFRTMAGNIINNYR